MLAAEHTVAPVDFPRDAALDPALAHLSPACVLDLARERLQSVTREVRESWRACRMIEALYHPGRYVRAAFVLLSDEEAPAARYWPEHTVFYLQSPVREPVSRRGARLEIEGVGFEAYVFPEDRRLRGLRKFAGRATAARAWQLWLDGDDGFRLDPASLRRTLIRYVPEQKWVARLRGRGNGGDEKRSIAVRAGRESVCASLQVRHDSLAHHAHAAGGPFHVPRVRGRSPGLIATEWVRGTSLVDRLQAGDVRDTCRAVSQAVHALHGARVPGLKSLSGPAVIRRARQSAEDLERACPDLGWRLHDLVARLRGRQSYIPPAGDGAGAALHNDLHWNQLRFAGDRLVLFDLERMCAGDPLMDAANLATQLRMLGWRPETLVGSTAAEQWASAFEEAWQAVSGRGIDAAAWGIYAAVSLLELARGMMRHLRPGWRALAARCLELAEASLK